MLVKLDHFPKVRGENKKYLSCHQLDYVYFPTSRTIPLLPRYHCGRVDPYTSMTWLWNFVKGESRKADFRGFLGDKFFLVGG